MSVIECSVSWTFPGRVRSVVVEAEIERFGMPPLDHLHGSFGKQVRSVAVCFAALFVFPEIWLSRGVSVRKIVGRASEESEVFVVPALYGPKLFGPANVP